MIEVIKAFEPTQKHIRAGQVFTYLLSSGEEYYGLVVKHNWTLGPFQKCLLLYLFDATTEIDFRELSIKEHKLLIPPAIAGTECWRQGYFSIAGKIELSDNIYPMHYFDFASEICDENLITIESPSTANPISKAQYPVDLGLLGLIEQALNSQRDDFAQVN